MKKLFTVFLLLFTGFAYAGADDVLGTWITEKGDTGNQIIVEIYKKPNGMYHGVIRKFTEPVYIYHETLDGEDLQGQEIMDIYHPDPKRHRVKLVGQDFLFNFKYDKDDQEYTGGLIYNPDNGKTYYSYMELQKNGQLKVKGSIDKLGWIGVTQYWKRYPLK
ncbi:MAG: DUF2147 domain-containing protein [Alcaligenaceae bacterium]|nr:DUF2147 domain-containing protein [Alcaligenaceae bacterium]